MQDQGCIPRIHNLIAASAASALAHRTSSRLAEQLWHPQPAYKEVFSARNGHQSEKDFVRNEKNGKMKKCVNVNTQRNKTHELWSGCTCHLQSCVGQPSAFCKCSM